MRSTGTRTIIFTTLIALFGTIPVAAQHGGGGGHMGGGGGHMGGSGSHMGGSGSHIGGSGSHIGSGRHSIGHYGGHSIGHYGGYYGGHYGGYYGLGLYYGWPYWGGWRGGPSAYIGAGYIDPDLPALTVVDTDISPEDAEVWLDGVYIGTADDFDGYPDYLYLKPGRYRLEFRYQGYETYALSLDARPGQKVNLNKNLPHLAGARNLDAIDPVRRPMPYGRAFEPGGKPTALTDARTEDDADYDAHRHGAGRNDMEPQSGQAERAPAAALGANQGSLRILVLPDDAAVYLDDRLIGTAEYLLANRRGVRASAGKHTITIVRPGFKTKTVDVEVVSGKAINVVADLEK